MVTDGKESGVRYGIVNFERRKYPRFSVDLPIEYYHVDSPVLRTGRAVNASEGGLLIYFHEKVEIGQHLRLKLFFPSGPELEVVETLVEVIWMDIHLGKDWGDYRCGVGFIDIPPENLEKVKSFLRSLS